MSNSNSTESVLQLTISVAEVEKLKAEIVRLINQVADLTAENESLKRQLDTERSTKPNPSVIKRDRNR